MNTFSVKHIVNKNNPCFWSVLKGENLAFELLPEYISQDFHQLPNFSPTSFSLAYLVNPDKPSPVKLNLSHVFRDLHSSIAHVTCSIRHPFAAFSKFFGSDRRFSLPVHLNSLDIDNSRNLALSRPADDLSLRRIKSNKPHVFGSKISDILNPTTSQGIEESVPEAPLRSKRRVSHFSEDTFYDVRVSFYRFSDQLIFTLFHFLDNSSLCECKLCVFTHTDLENLSRIHDSVHSAQGSSKPSQYSEHTDSVNQTPSRDSFRHIQIYKRQDETLLSTSPKGVFDSITNRYFNISPHMNTSKFSSFFLLSSRQKILNLDLKLGTEDSSTLEMYFSRPQNSQLPLDTAHGPDMVGTAFKWGQYIFIVVQYLKPLNNVPQPQTQFRSTEMNLPSLKSIANIPNTSSPLKPGPSFDQDLLKRRGSDNTYLLSSRYYKNNDNGQDYRQPAPFDLASKNSFAKDRGSKAMYNNRYIHSSYTDNRPPPVIDNRVPPNPARASENIAYNSTAPNNHSAVNSDRKPSTEIQHSFYPNKHNPQIKEPYNEQEAMALERYSNREYLYSNNAPSHLDQFRQTNIFDRRFSQPIYMTDRSQLDSIIPYSYSTPLAEGSSVFRQQVTSNYNTNSYSLVKHRKDADNTGHELSSQMPSSDFENRARQGVYFTNPQENRLGNHNFHHNFVSVNNPDPYNNMFRRNSTMSYFSNHKGKVPDLIRSTLTDQYSFGIKKQKISKCLSCGVTHSPEWRKGPEGVKTLCNACGLRYSRSLKKESEKQNT
ncbi:hypothetical protein BB560_004494 [Smittium megazygosporum]|uniref:GATA-type domain-containing protein n=1 Tax=Smittium megazygosporum TaxID=133381 RepID=A0A2T9Z930_9FUNG|nr:hypothetical protein BB560_004494 [Smittium megazygosporum]